jgi:hypothetical protein
LAGSRAAMSHTGALVGNDAVFDAALRRCGVVRVATYAELFFAARQIGSGRLPQGNRLAIVTNGGGPGVMAADRAADLALPLATLSADTLERLRPALPSNWSHGNPLDLIGDAGSPRVLGQPAAAGPRGPTESPGAELARAEEGGNDRTQISDDVTFSTLGFSTSVGGYPADGGSTSPRRRAATGVGAPSARGGCPRRGSMWGCRRG